MIFVERLCVGVEEFEIGFFDGQEIQVIVLFGVVEVQVGMVGSDFMLKVDQVFY